MDLYKNAVCAITNCPIRSNNMFISPKNETNLSRWKKALKIQQDKFFVCQEHFEDKFIEKKPRGWSMPTLWINNDVDNTADHCESCFKSLKNLNVAENAYNIDKRLKEMFLDVTGCEISTGVVCFDCIENVRAFHKFKRRIKTSREIRNKMKEHLKKFDVNSKEIKAETPTRDNLAPNDHRIKIVPMKKAKLDESSTGNLKNVGGRLGCEKNDPGSSQMCDKISSDLQLSEQSISNHQISLDLNFEPESSENSSAECENSLYEPQEKVEETSDSSLIDQTSSHPENLIKITAQLQLNKELAMQPKVFKIQNPRTITNDKLNLAINDKRIVIGKPPLKIVSVQEKVENIKEEPNEDQISSTIDLKEEKVLEPALKIKEEPSINPTEQIITSDDSQFIIREIEPPQNDSSFQIPKFDILNPQPSTSRISNPTRTIKTTSQTPTNPLQQRKTLKNKKGAIKLTQHQINLLEVPTQSHKCPFCPNHFVNEKFVNEHVRQKHTFVCITCNRIFAFKITLIRHHISAHGAPVGSVSGKSVHYQYECPICCVKFITIELREKHMMEKHNVMLKDERKDAKQLVIYKPSKPQTRNSLPKPDPPSRILTRLRVRKRPVSYAPSFAEDSSDLPCLDCGLRFEADQLLKHRTECHSFDAHTYTCDICGTKIMGKDGLENHMKIHLTLKMVKFK